jgi:hypothetical protein
VRIAQFAQIANEKGLSFDHVTVFMPVLSKEEAQIGSGQRCNEYRIFQEKGIVKIQFDTDSFLTQEI